MERLSGPDREILQLVVEGKSSAEMSEILSLSPKTVETYRSRLMMKLGIKDLPSLVKFAVQHGLSTPALTQMSKSVEGIKGALTYEACILPYS